MISRSARPYQVFPREVNSGYTSGRARLDTYSIVRSICQGGGGGGDFGEKDTENWGQKEDFRISIAKELRAKTHPPEDRIQ